MQRHPNNPILTRLNIPAILPHLSDVSSVFNPGAIRIGDQYLLLLRVQNRGRESYLMTARSTNGVDFRVDTSAVELRGFEAIGGTVYHVYDPRITPIDGQMYVTVSLDTDQGCRVGLATTEDFSVLDFVGLLSEADARNGVLFPKRIDGRYLVLMRPNQVALEEGLRSGSDIWLYESDDLKTWRPRGCVMHGRPRYWDELIGSGPPPVETREGWLHVYHGIATHFASVNIYQAGVVLLDHYDPTRVIARSRYNILEPRESYELVGQVPNVVFPTGLVVDEFDADGCAVPDSRVLVYYGAADTVVCVAETTIRRLLQQCREGESDV